jgi:hypothetical protein
VRVTRAITYYRLLIRFVFRKIITWMFVDFGGMVLKSGVDGKGFELGEFPAGIRNQGQRKGDFLDRIMRSCPRLYVPTEIPFFQH